jgi:hypothetical protein
VGFFQAKSHLPSIFTRSFRYLGKRSCSILAPAKAAGLPQKERKHSLCRAKETLQESRVLWQLQGKAHLVRASDTFASILGSEKNTKAFRIVVVGICTRKTRELVESTIPFGLLGRWLLQTLHLQHPETSAWQDDKEHKIIENH